ncbi:MAG: response regulator [Alphaproteobacteria bacterium]|jgi:CheY-like chemotaxis protein|nr:response regulator [Alphaproteobacteria bacterium]MDP6517838.1 response regulator [Alphaproteobacteria bacterium]|tara:strand:+ start:52 stop:558 length:507 start_codon:yes stop_codon:yes gene_type:complete
MSELRLNYLKVLVVDDNRSMLFLISDLLRALGVGNIITATNGAEAIQILIDQAAAPVDIVITDISMEPVDGAELLEWVRKNPKSANRFMPVIVLTGHTELARIVQMRDLGATEILAKPVTVMGLSNRMVTVIDRPRRFVEIESYFGPDRRRRTVPYSGDDRRKANKGD